MTTQRKPKASTPHEVDRGGRVYVVQSGGYFKGTPAEDQANPCSGCGASVGAFMCLMRGEAWRACLVKEKFNGGPRLTLHPVPAVG